MFTLLEKFHTKKLKAAPKEDIASWISFALDLTTRQTRNGGQVIRSVWHLEGKGGQARPKEFQHGQLHPENEDDMEDLFNEEAVLLTIKSCPVKMDARMFYIVAIRNYFTLWLTFPFNISQIIHVVQQ